MSLNKVQGDILIQDFFSRLVQGCRPSIQLFYNIINFEKFKLLFI